MKRFIIWKRNNPDNEGIPRQWTATAHSVKGRSANDARSKMERMFRRAGFSNMSLLAIPEGLNPNKTVCFDEVYERKEAKGND